MSLGLEMGTVGSSKLLKSLAWYFTIGGIVFAFMAVSGLISGVALHWPSLGTDLPYPGALLIVSAASVALLTTGFLLARRSRIGGILGLALTLYPFVFAISDRRKPSLLELGIAVLTILALLFVWRELQWPRAGV